jgi:hypothetical protein
MFFMANNRVKHKSTFSQYHIKSIRVQLGVPVQIPNLLTRPRHRCAMGLIQRDKPIDLPLGMNPTQRMFKDIKLPRIVTYNRQAVGNP